MKWFKINGREFNVKVIEIEENFNILYSENTGRVAAVGAALVLDPYGTFYGHTVTVGAKKGHEEELNELFNYISQPRFTGMTVSLPHGNGVITYNAYVSNGRRKIKKIREDVLGNIEYTDYETFSINFISMSAQVTQ